MWIFWTIVSFLLISSVQFTQRYYGMCWTSYIIYIVVCVGVTGWSLPLSYELAPSLLHPWFVSIGCLSILGLLGSIFIFHDVVSVWNYVGAVVILIGSSMMMIK
jgi:hypothetical protein